MQRPIITLTTDFGLEDHYAGTMKGVLLSSCADAQLVDISHDVRKFNLYAGAYAIDQAAPYFPAGSVHLVVIDPGVGTERKPVLLHANKQFFVAPDNGVLSLIRARDPGATAREISNKDLWLPSVSHTFHGRDIFAPVAAAVAAGSAQPEDVGSILEDPVMLPGLEPHEIERNHWQGMVLSVDHFGNVITNFRAGKFRAALSTKFFLEAGSGRVTEARQTFGQAEPGLCFAYAGSSGYLEIGLNQGDAARELMIEPGVWVELRIAD